MKNLLLYVLLLLGLALISEKGSATNYYFSTTDGDDSRTAAQAQNSATPWKTLSKLNSFMSSLQPGDAVLFKSGDIFYGTITVSKSGSSGSPITFGAYGSGSKPVISGFYAVPSWTSAGGNLWTATVSSAQATMNMLTINGSFQPIGRWPKLTASNSGYLTYQSFSGTTSVTSNAIASAPNFVGGEVVIRADHYNIDRGTISAQSSNSVTYKMATGGPLEALTNNFGLFFQNHPNACTQQGDWCFVPGSKTVEVYSSGAPSNVNVSVTPYNASVTSSNYITFQGLAFTGSNTAAVNIASSNNVKVESCDISFAGTNGVSTNSSCSSIYVENSSLAYVMNNGIDCNNVTNWMINGNTMQHIGDIAGMGVSGDGEYVAMAYIGNNSTIQYNSLSSMGYHGIQLGGSAKNFTVQYNLVQGFCLVKDDGGGIYTYKNSGTGTKIIQSNIVLDGIGAPNGTSNGTAGGGSIGIYSDGASDYLQIINNTVANCTDMGFLTNDGLSPTLRGNTFFNNGTGSSTGSAVAYVHWSGQTAISNLNVKKNIFCAKTAGQFTSLFLSNETAVAIKNFFGASDSNYFAKPISSNPVILTQNGAVSNLSISQWQSSSSQDAHSKGSPMTVTDANSIRFEYNASASSKVVNLGATYMDMTGATHSGSITLPAYGSAVLLYVSGTVSNQPPVANAGLDQNMTLPINSTSLNGSGTDPDGTISSYAWTKIAGPSQYTIGSASQAQTTLSNLVQGIYQFQLKVTDNAGATDLDTVTITVNAGANQPPVAVAGSAQVIVLPISTALLDGTASHDPDGTIASYSWTKISGPAGAIILTPTLPTTTVTTLIQGVYQFQLTVTDNAGATGTSTVTINVNAPANQPPTANAGVNINITLPLNTVTLNGSGSDPDGSISSYQWTKISGPSSYSIVSPGQAQTSVTNLVQGVYQFQLTVTDNSGATATASVTVVVNAPVNQPPTANAGVNINITLPVNSVTLSGSGSDPDGTINSYQWTKISGPSSFSIVNPGQPQTSVNNLVQGIYQFQLTVTDNAGATATATVNVVVNASVNQPPTADAGADIAITLPTNSVTLNGSGNDPDGTISSYAWTKTAGPGQYNLVSAGQPQTTVNNLVAGTYTFRLTVTDNSGATATSSVNVVVNPAPNQPPTADAGADVAITLPVNSVSLNGVGTDVDGTISSYQWTKIAGPSQYTIGSPTRANTTISNLVQGIYTFQLTVTDNSGASAQSTVQIFVNPANLPQNQAPTANAGQDINITLPTNTVTLNGTGIDADGSINSYQWNMISGPAQFTIGAASSASTAVSGLAAGTYQFELTVTDNQGATGADTVTVTVNAAPNQAPTSNAGSDIAITLPVNTITLAGSGSDADGTVSNYQWAMISGPSQYSIVSPTQAQTVVNNLVEGVYQFQLMVTDDQGATSTDIVVVTVIAATNIPPVADAGSDFNITLPVNSVRFLGSGTDADGSITTYQWTKLSGPFQYNIGSPTQAQTNVTNLVQGTYSFVLKVTDNSGAVARDTVTVIVNPAINQPPVANAGADLSITLPTNNVSVRGSGSDPDGSISKYQWTKISGPAQYVFSSTTRARTTISNMVQGVYQFVLTVTDNSGATATDTLQVTVNPAAQVPNQAPKANAGTDITITLPVSSTSLTGSGTDADGTIAAYQWSEVSGPAQFNLVAATQAQTTVNGLVAGVYQFELLVTDNKGATGADTVNVTVNPAPNVPPTANAGADVTITLPLNSANVSGSGNDVDGTIAAYKWSKVSGPIQFNITDATQTQTVIDGLVAGVYTFALTVTDNNGATAKDTMKITVNPAVNIAPVANAGSDITVTLPTNSATLTGSGTDADGSIASYLWTKVSGPSQFNIVSSTKSQTNISNLSQGVYLFVLRVTDNQGLFGRDTVKVTVNAAPVNQPPVANAGVDINITLPVNTVNFSGTGTDADGTIAGYLWTKITGPTQYSIQAVSQAQTQVTNLAQGVYTFQLKVTDNKGATARDTIQVIVNPAPVNQPPVANAGADINITLPVNTVNFSGTGTDADGTIASYLWTKITGPTQYSIQTANQAQTQVTNLVQGVYTFQLKVTDNNGATARDTIQVIVNPAPVNQPPVANAGADINITLPVNTVNFSGTGTDADGTIAFYLWTKITGPTQYSIQAANQAQTQVINLVQGVYTFQLKVTDNNGATASDTIQVTVNPAPVNQPPVASAGADINITLPVNTVNFSGTGTDADGTIASYLWTKITGPTQYSIQTANQAQTQVTNLVQGVYTFQLKVTDNNGATARDTIQVTVNAAPVNQPPVASAGADINITLPLNNATLNGSGTDADGSIVAYAWTKVAGPSQYAIGSPAQVQTAITNLAQGIYQFVLTVTDDQGATGKDTVTVTVNASANKAPVANAGSDIHIKLPLDSVLLSGSGTDADGTIVSYSWAMVDGPTQYQIVSPNSAQTMVNNLAKGVYQFELTVTDNSGASAKDTVSVIVDPVNQLENTPPIANAGPDINLVLPANSAILSGTGVDSDGKIASFHWTLISGPGSYSMPDASDAQITVTDLVEGVYQFELMVTDNLGAIGRDTVNVTVSQEMATTAKIFPNPATSTINIQIKSTSKTNGSSMRIYDAKGVLVYQERFMRTNQVMTRQVDVSKLPNGVYYVEMNADINKIMTLMFVKQ